MLQASNNSSSKTRDNIRCPLDPLEQFTIRSKTDYVKLQWFEEEKEEVELPNRKRFRICDAVGKNETERRENQLFPAELILIPNDFPALSSNAAHFASGDTYQRLDYLGVSKINSTEGSAITFVQDESGMSKNLITVRKYVSQKMASDNKDLEDEEDN
jgi:hypothetical protein